MLNELNNICIKIPILQDIMEIPIFANIIKELCIVKTRRKRKNIQRVQPIRKIVDIMMGKPIIEKYLG